MCQGIAGSGTRTYPRYMNWVFGAHFLWCNTLLSIEAVGRDLILPQVCMPDHVDSLKKDLTPLRCEWGMVAWDVGVERRKGGGTGVGI